MAGIIDPAQLLETLIAYPRETEWLEFKENKFSPDEVGRYVSALANAAMLHSEDHGYLVFGVADGTHEVVGTTVHLKETGKGAEPFEVWLSKLLHPSIHFEIVAFDYHGKHVELVRIFPGYMMPVRFKSQAWIRVDSALRPLSEVPGREQALWAIASRFTFERAVAAAHLDEAEVFELFDPARLFEQMGVPKLSRKLMIERLITEELLIRNKEGGFDATNLLALLAARDITRFSHLAKKVARVVRYKGTSKIAGIEERYGKRGYAIGFNGLLEYIMDRVDHKEEMIHGTRTTIYAIPAITMRELVANALVHQDLTSQGDGPFIEIFSDRVRITNPGASLVAPDRLIDSPPRSRNQMLANFMSRLGFFEGRGSGVDRAIDAVEKMALTPPLFQVVENSFVVTLFAAKSFTAMSKEDRIRGCYQHACLRFEASMTMSNQSLRDRYGLAPSQASTASQVISDAKEAGKIKPVDEDQANRVARYIPYWA